MTKQRFSVLFIGSIGIIATFLPWNTVPILGSLNGIAQPMGKASLVFLAIAVIISLIGNRQEDLRRWKFYVPLIAIICATLASFIHFAVFTFDIGYKERDALDAVIAEQVKLDFGLYISLFAEIMLCIMIFIMRTKRIVYPEVKETHPYRKKRQVIGNIESSPASIPKKKVIKTAPKSPPKTEIPKTVSSESQEISQLKKESKEKKDFKPSDHNRFMPK